jgi:SAM-dependent methyltransferase
MPKPNYESEWWGYIYDQMMAQQPGVVETHLRFYTAQLRGVSGPILECACGTGLFLLPLLGFGYDAYGFDSSSAMLSTLARKAAREGRSDIDDRISVQDMERFRYDRSFDTILIPTNSFCMLATQEAQIAALRNVHAHLTPGGRLLFDLRLAGVRELATGALAVQGRWHTWTHPETGRPIRQRVDGTVDFNAEQVLDRCFIEYDGETVEFPMTGRWIFKAELTLLLRLAGFRGWSCFGTPEGEPLVLGPEEQHSYWVAEKA